MTRQLPILLVHDKPKRCQIYADMLSAEGYNVDTADNGESAIKQEASQEYEVIVLDVLMPNTKKDAVAGCYDQAGGLYALREIRKHNPILPVILFSRNEPSDSIKEQLREYRIFDYLVRDEDNFQFKFINRVRNAVEVYESRKARLRKSPDFVFNSTAMKTIFIKARKIAESDIPVLISGETGTGKSLLALEIHNCSNRADQPYLELNCASIPETLVESYLFGHMKGAFTGAVSNKRGYFERADGGTLFLDEIGEMSPAIQAKLLQVLETGKFSPIGAEEELTVDVRILCATNRALDAMVQDGSFRDDLYYRICYEHLTLPPLRERKEDLSVLVDFFVKQFEERNNRKVTVRPAVYEQLQSYPLYGNVRELKSVVKAALYRLEHNETIFTRFHLSPVSSKTMRKEATAEVKDETNSLFDHGPVNLDDLISNYKFNVIEKAMEHSNNVAEKAAALLGMNAHTLRRQLRDRSLPKK